MVRRRIVFGAAVVLLSLGAWAVHHAWAVVAVARGDGPVLEWVFAAGCAWLMLQTVLAYSERVWRVTSRQQRHLDAARVVVLVPVYNEDPGALQAGLASLLAQTRLPQAVCVVDDGSTAAEYSGVQGWFEGAAAELGVRAHWVRTPNGGKRHAQGVGVRLEPTADIYLTVDSDSLLADDALDEGLKPFVDRRVQSVAGVVVAINNRYGWRDGVTAAVQAFDEANPNMVAWPYRQARSRRALRRYGRRRSWVAVRGLVRAVGRDLLCRASDLWFVVGQLSDRSAASTMGSVLVNSGPLALYRGELIRDHLDGYLNETFFGRRIEMSDDSQLTLYALRRGRAVQQPTAFAFTLMPETWSQHRRQYMRWMRGAFVRSWWRARYLPLGGWAYWAHLGGWIQMAMSTAVFIGLFFVGPTISGEYLAAWPWLLIVPIIVGYGQALRYLMLRRSDQPLPSALATVALAPIAAIYAYLVLRVMRWWAMCTPLKGGWGTRQTIEITLGGGHTAPTPAEPGQRFGRHATDRPTELLPVITG